MISSFQWYMGMWVTDRVFITIFASTNVTSVPVFQSFWDAKRWTLWIISESIVILTYSLRKIPTAQWPNSTQTWHPPMKIVAYRQCRRCLPWTEPAVICPGMSFRKFLMAKIVHQELRQVAKIRHWHIASMWRCAVASTKDRPPQYHINMWYWVKALAHGVAQTNGRGGKQQSTCSRRDAKCKGSSE